MGDIDETVGQIVADVEKLEYQIEALLQSLKNNDTIQEADLVPIYTSPNYVPENSTLTNEDILEDITRMDIDEEKDRQKELNRLRTLVSTPGGFVPKESDIFLIPVLDKWVFGITLTNISTRPFCRPDLILQLQTRLNKGPRNCSAFSYDVQTRLLGVDLEKNIIRKDSHSIPYQDPMDCTDENLSTGNMQMIQSGCDVVMTAAFGHPLNLCDDLGNEFTLLVSLCCGQEHMWSRSIRVNYNDPTTLYNHEKFIKYQDIIITALSTHREAFKIGQQVSEKDSANTIVGLNSFFSLIGFENIKCENSSNGTPIDVLIPSIHSMMWGSILRMEKYCSMKKFVRCSLSTRSPEQMEIFYRIFCNWLRKRKSEKKQGAPHITVYPMYRKKPQNLVKTLNSEMDQLVELINLSHKGITPDDNKENIWINTYYKCMLDTDATFMQHFRDSN